MKKLDLLYEGKAKRVYETEDETILIVSYKDDATAFNGLKKGTIEDKGSVNNRVSNYLMKVLEEQGIPTHYVQELSHRETAVKKVKIIPLEVIVRNTAAGSLAKRLGLSEGTNLKRTVLEYCYKNDELGDPMINTYHIEAMELATKGELEIINEYAMQINTVLKEYFSRIGIQLVDFKLEFGKTKEGQVILADEISPDTCRLWDKATGEKLDKDRFRRDLGQVEVAYQEILNRVFNSFDSLQEQWRPKHVER